MNSILFDTYIRRDAARSGWENCEPDAAGTGRWLSSTAHEGLLLAYPEGDFFVIVPTYCPVCRVTAEELADTLRELSRTDTAPKGVPPLRTEREQIVTVRTAQTRYRTALEQVWGSTCPLTGISRPDLLRASHAKPWSDCTDAERIDPYNGFLLEARPDALFDRGYISFADDGTLLISPRLTPAEHQALGLSSLTPALRLSPRHIPFLRYHRDRIFLR
ncbi:MAG: HNH endonuclease [Akkermansia muciniphila]